MAAGFVRASSQRLLNSSFPIVAAPFTIGCWVYPNQNATGACAWSLTDTAAVSSYWRLNQNASFGWLLQSSEGAGASNTTVSDAALVGSWHYTVCRIISATNRRLSILTPSGLASHAQDIVSRTPTSIDTLAIGSSETSSPSLFYDGLIAEFWCSSADVQSDGGQLDNALFRQLAYGGPFSVPHIAKDIIEYRSLRKYPTSEGDQVGEVFHGLGGRQTWTNSNGVTTGAHPPLPYWYVKPGQTPRALVF